MLGDNAGTARAATLEEMATGEPEVKAEQPAVGVAEKTVIAWRCAVVGLFMCPRACLQSHLDGIEELLGDEFTEWNEIAVAQRIPVLRVLDHVANANR